MIISFFKKKICINILVSVVKNSSILIILNTLDNWTY